MRYSARDRTQAYLASQLAISFGDICSSLLVAGIHEPNARLDSGLIERIKTMSAESCNPIDAALAQAGNKNFDCCHDV
jgi:hypothetical protein